MSSNDKEENLFDYVYNQPGSMPGTLSIPEDAVVPEIILVDYNTHKAVRRTNLTPEDCISYLDSESVSWVEVLGCQITPPRVVWVS